MITQMNPIFTAMKGCGLIIIIIFLFC